MPLRQPYVVNPNRAGHAPCGTWQAATVDLSKATSRSLKHVEDQRVLAITETSDPRAKVNVDKEDAVREAQPSSVAHALSLALPRTLPRTHGQNCTDRGYPLVRLAAYRIFDRTKATSSISSRVRSQ
jgi:hypothetical protein